MHRLAAALCALTVIVASGTAPTFVATPSYGAVAADARSSPMVLTAPLGEAGQQSIDDALTDRETQVARRAEAAEVARGAAAVAAAEVARAAHAERVQAERAQLDAALAAQAQAEQALADQAQAEQARADQAQRDQELAAQAAEAARAAQVAETTSQVQRALLALGYSGVGAVDGIAGRHTTASVRAFQADAGHRVTGEASAATLTQLTEKVDAGWHRPAPVAKAVAPRSAPAPAAPAPAAAAPAAARPAWTTYVANSGGQATIDLCAGGLTAFYGDDGHAFFSVPYLTIHNTCGGAPLLRVSVGDTIALTGGGLDGTYRVADSRDVSQGSTTAAVAGVVGDILLQTCYFNSTTMRVVGATKVS